MVNGIVKSAVLKGLPSHDCCLIFPRYWRIIISASPVSTFHIESKSNASLVVSWAGRVHDEKVEGNDSIYLSSRLIKLNGFIQDEEVVVKEVPCPTFCPRVTMVVKSITEWEELALNIEVAQEAFLSQIRVLQLNQIVPLWLDGGAVVNLKVQHLTPNNSTGLLQVNTIVEILPPEKEHNEITPVTLVPYKGKNETLLDVNDIFHIMKYIYPLILKNGLCLSKEIILYLKIIPYLSHINNKNDILRKLLTFHPTLIIVSKKHLKSSVFYNKKYFVANMILRSKYQNEITEETFNLFVVVLIWENIICSLTDLSICVQQSISELLKQRIGIASDGLQKRLSSFSNIVSIDTTGNFSENDFYEVDITSGISYEKEITSFLKSTLKEVCQICPLIFNDSTTLSILINGNSLDILLSIKNKKPIYLDELSISLLTLNFNAQSLDFVSQTQDEINNLHPDNPMVEDLKKIIIHNLELFNNVGSSPQHILLQGCKWSGKTNIVETLSENLSHGPYCFYFEMIKFKNLKGKKVESIKKTLKKIVKNALDNQPSLIIFEDIDFICPSPSSTDQDKGSVHDYIFNACIMIKNLLQQLLYNSKVTVSSNKCFVMVIATCISRNFLNPYLASPKGKHLFPVSIQIPPLNADQKFLFLKRYLTSCLKNFVPCINLDEQFPKDRLCKFSGHLLNYESYSLKDLTTLSQRILLAAQFRWSEIDSGARKPGSEKNFKQIDSYNITDEDFKKALLGFSSLATKALKHSMKNKDKQRQRVGGMVAAKESLREMVEWPLQFRHLFKQTSLRLRSGVLLYGPPGCGKTLLANSFVSSLDMNSIVIKGPELLSKYIGQSEKSVREAFEKAQSVKPCILFFDEFEAIAPRRGHDSTGVTDRVVNQLLTEIDGVEGLLDVYVLGATSRPDLIDPALLRPGRFDKTVYCPIPDQNDRLEILQILSEELSFGEIVDMVELSEKTKGFTGADLQSLLSTAQVKAAQELLGIELYKDIYVKDENGGTYSKSVQLAPMDVNYIDERSVQMAPADANYTDEKCVQMAPVDANYTDDKKVHLIDNGNVSDKNHNKHDVAFVMKRHIKQAFSEVRPSISFTEKLKYNELYQLFSISRENSVFVPPGTRESLA